MKKKGAPMTEPHRSPYRQTKPPIATRATVHPPDPRIDQLAAQVAVNGPRIATIETDLKHLHDYVAEVKNELAKNTQVTQQVADILGTFKVTGQIAKWVASVAAAVGGVYAALRGWRS